MILTTKIITMVWSLTESWTSWRVRSRGSWEALVPTKVVKVTEF